MQIRQMFQKAPKKCKYFFLKNSCKFNDDCEFSHDSENCNAEEIEAVRLEIDKVKEKNYDIKSQND